MRRVHSAKILELRQAVPSTTASPSIVKLFALMRSAVPAMAVDVQS